MNSIQNAVSKSAPNAAAQSTINQAASKNVNVMINSLLDSEDYRKRFNELMGARTPQFVSSIISLINGDANLKKAFIESPISIIQSALKAATFDLPIDPNLGYAYIVPFNNSYKDENGNWRKKMEATFIMGYKGMNQLALRSGVYKTINVVDVREGELKSYNRLTEETEIEFISDDDERDKKQIVGWCGHFRLMNGTEKTIYMTKKQIMAHELKNRKGESMGKGWREDFDSMALKTVFRKLIGKFGVMSIDYQQKADSKTIAVADALARGQFDDEDKSNADEKSTVIQDNYEVNVDTGEAIKIAAEDEKA